MNLPENLKLKLNTLEQILAHMPSAALAFSGGVDSTFLLAMAKTLVRGKLLAINVDSEFVPEKETAQAKVTAQNIGVECLSIKVKVLDDEQVIQNTSQRCYFCKKKIFSLVRQEAEQHQISHLLHGVNLDDLGDFRPGLKAAEELGFLSPLAEARLTKADIRKLSRALGLDTWDKPSQSCLATRIPYDDVITDKKLFKIQAAEEVLHHLGFSQVRVRYFGHTARVEVAPEKVALLSGGNIQGQLRKAFERIGFSKITIDKDGYETGKMNHEILTG